METLFLGIMVIAGAILFFRFVGAWMLRINEVITLLKKIEENTKKDKAE